AILPPIHARPSSLRDLRCESHCLNALTPPQPKASTPPVCTIFTTRTAHLCGLTRVRCAIALLAAVFFTALFASAQTPPNPAAPHFVVVLDAAHGGTDSGATFPDGQPEKSVALALNVRLRSLLAARGLTVVTTRESDIALVADQRAAIANRAKAQLCLVLHATQSGSGVHIFASSLAPAAPSRYLPWKTAQAAFVARSLSLAGALNSDVLHSGFNVTLARVSLPGLDSLACPAVAVELAPKRGSDNSILAEPDDAQYQSQVVSALVDAIFAWRSETPQP
ncbi:MAG TPA: N-acetylmuramoyl-L-alanine amidase, partial [Terracidiphilus sp.]|nr:N-acetylmuramoyl-L-alanine amidase [Terracidiphilus sp.]